MVKAFYQSIHYEPIRDRFVRRASPGNAVTFSDRYPLARTKILDYFDEMSAERVGVLHGDYLVHPSGMYLVDRKGLVTAGCISWEDPSIHPWLSKHAEQFETQEFIQTREQWDHILQFRGLPILCDPYERNYFHFSLEMTGVDVEQTARESVDALSRPDRGCFSAPYCGPKVLGRILHNARLCGFVGWSGDLS